MKEFIYHALGFCGEHWHLNAINIMDIIIMGYITIKIITYDNRDSKNRRTI